MPEADPLCRLLRGTRVLPVVTLEDVDSALLVRAPRMNREHRFQHSDEAAGALASKVADWLRAALTARGEARLVVSGGQTPRPFFHRLREVAMPWSEVHVTVAEERWVAVKWEVYRRALAAGCADELPIRALLRQAPAGVDIFWAAQDRTVDWVHNRREW